MGKIIEETMLVMVDTRNNNNKFYHVTLEDDDTVTKRWGRVGAEGASSSERTGRIGYTRAIASKQKKGYKVSPIVNSGIVGYKNTNHLPEIAKKFLTKNSNDTTIQDLINRLVKANQHQILEQSGGQIKVDDDGTVKTALGVVDIPAITQARSLLSKMQSPSTKKAGLLEEYLTIIPQNVGYRAGWADNFLKPENFSKQVDFLKQLEDAVQWRNTTKAATLHEDDDFNLDDHANLFRLQLDKISDAAKEFDRINQLFKKTRNSIHQSRDYKLVNVFAVEDRPENVKAYETAFNALGNQQELWHGTKAANVLSILTKGFYVPPVRGGSVHVTGRMFGDGVYFSNQSTKSLNYASGYWTGEKNSNNCFMLLNDVVMGKEYHPTHSGNMREAYTGRYNSINVKAGTAGVRNHEAIVWNTEQIHIKYLCEFAA